MENNINSHYDLNNLYSINYLSKILTGMRLEIPEGDLPEEEFTSTIKLISDKSNPIIFTLQNGSKLFFTFFEYRRLHGKPEIGKNIKYSLQKISNKNKKNQAYMITKCIIF